MTARDAGLLLAALLWEPGKARRQWVARCDGVQQDRVVYAAVAQVLAEHLWDTGEVSEAETGLPRQLRDKVRRALTGQNMTWSTLRQLIGAFELAESDAARLEVAMEQPPPREAGASEEVIAPAVRRYRTLSITEHHWVGADRCPVRHETTQVLLGTGEPMASHFYMFDTNTIDVRIKQGARRVGDIQHVHGDIYGVELELLRPLEAGQTTTLSYESLFSYPSPPEPEFRRAAFEGLSSLDIRVAFHPDAVPASIAFGEWDQIAHHEPSATWPVRLEEDLSVHRFLAEVQSSIVGFRWTW